MSFLHILGYGSIIFITLLLAGLVVNYPLMVIQQRTNKELKRIYTLLDERRK